MRKLSSTIILSGFVLAFVCLINGCSKTSAPAACIGTLPSTASLNAAVIFTSCTSGASAYLWSFGDGQTANGQTVTHTYTSIGTYTGTLTVTNNSGSNAKNFTITIVNNNWTFLGNAFSADSVVGSATGNDLTAYGVSGSNKADLVVVFPTLPTATGNYTVININNAPPVGQQLYVVVYNFNSSGQQISSYGSTGSGNITVPVTVSGGKLSVSLPSIELSNLGGGTVDSASLIATINQTQ